MKTAIDSYLDTIGKHELLSRDEERNLASIIQGNYSDKEKQKATEVLVESNLKLVVTIAFKFARSTGTPAEDLISAGNEGLMEAVRRVDPNKLTKSKFSTYASWWIKQGIKKYLYASSHDVTIDSNIVDLRAKYLNFKKDGLGDEEIRDKMGWTKSKLWKVKMSNVRSTSMDLEIAEDGSTYGQTLEDENVLSPFTVIEKNEDKKELLAIVEGLDDLQKDIIVSRYLQDEKVRLEDLGVKHNLTRERIRQIEKQTLNDLKDQLTVE